MNDEDRRLEIFDKLTWRPARIHRGIHPGRSLEFPISKPKLFGRAVHTLEVVNAVMRDEYLETEARIVVVSLDPIDHVAAVTRAGRANAILVDELIALNKIRGAVHDVDVSFATPVTADLVYKSLTIPGRAARVRAKYDVAVVSEHLLVPTIAPVVVPGALRATVNQNNERILFVRVEVGRFDYETMNPFAERAGPFCVLGFSQTERRHQLAVHAGQCYPTAGVNVGAIDFGGH